MSRRIGRLPMSDTPFIRELYADFRIDAVRCARSINSAAARRGAVAELVITGRPAGAPPPPRS